MKNHLLFTAFCALLAVSMPSLAADKKSAAAENPAPKSSPPAMFQRSGLIVGAPAFEGEADATPPKLPPPDDLKKKADAGDAAAMREIGVFYHDGKEADWTAAHGWFMKAANKGDLDAAYYAGRDFWGSHGVSRDIPASLRWLNRAAKAGQPQALSLLGSILQWGEKGRSEVMLVPPDLKRAIPLLKKGAAKDEPYAEYRLALAFMSGVGATSDIPAGIGLMKKSAEQGFMLAQRKLGEIYYTDDPSLPHDLKLSAEYFTKAAEQGDLAAQYFLARFYNLGIGVDKDLAKAAEWYRRVDQHDELVDDNGSIIADYVMGAQTQLGIFYRDGTGVENNPVEAVRWFRRAAMLGSPGSQFRLGQSYENGVGVAADKIEAYRWYGMAASGLASPFPPEYDDASDKEAKAAIARLEKNMTPAEIAAGKTAAEDELRLQYQLASGYTWGLYLQQADDFWSVSPP